MTQHPAPDLWQHLVQWQPATAAAITQHVRALPDDWPQRVFGVGRPDAAITLPPAAIGEQYPDRTPEIAPYDDVADPESCPACTEAAGNCRWHEGFAQGHHDRVQAQIDAMKLRPDMPLREYALWEAEVSEALDNGQTPPVLPAAPSEPADTDRREQVVRAITDLHEQGGVYALDEPEMRRIADAVLAALPAPADRAAVLREEAASIRAHCPDRLDNKSVSGAWMVCHCAVADDIEHRMAAETQQSGEDT